MQRLLLRIGIFLAWVVVVWGCLVVAFGSADFYAAEFGGVVTGDMVMGEPAATPAQSSMEIAVGIGMIAAALFCNWRMRRGLKMPRDQSTA